jgi:NAD(P)-dependent dehydrogenase (short-subunit alcohol dehydrogenase family)
MRASHRRTLGPSYEAGATVSEELWDDKVIAVNQKGPCRLSVLLAQAMTERGGGLIVNISGAASIRTSARVAPYGAAKAGLNAITLALGRVGEASEVDGAVTHLADRNPASFPTGALLTVDGSAP